MERVGHLGHRALEGVPLGERAHQRQEVGQLAAQLALPTPTQPAEVLGREDVADEGDGERDQQRDRHQRAERQANRQDRDAQDQLGGVDLGRRQGGRIEPGADDVALRHLAGQGRHPLADPARHRRQHPLPGRPLGRHQADVSLARQAGGADRVVAGRDRQPGREERHQQAEDRGAGRQRAERG